MRGIHEIHTTFGGVLLKKMHFPAEFIRIAEFHHWNDFSSDDDKELLVIHLADYLANRTGFRYFDLEPGEDKTDPDFLSSLETMESLKQLKLSAAGILEIADEIKTVIKESAPAF
jgi:HD-like signal output (HDOD) protein